MDRTIQVRLIDGNHRLGPKRDRLPGGNHAARTPRAPHGAVTFLALQGVIREVQLIQKVRPALVLGKQPIYPDTAKSSKRPDPAIRRVEITKAGLKLVFFVATRPRRFRNG